MIVSRRTLGIISAGTLVAAAIVATAQSSGVEPGGPLPGLTAVEFEEFRLGLDDFLEVETSDEGLGPAFNGTSCAACHNVPAIGGVSPVSEVRAGRLTAAGFEPLVPSGDTLFHLFSIPTHSCQPPIPPHANVIARRVPVPVFGAGLIEAIEDETIRGREDPQDRDRDGISGRAAIVTDVATGDRRVGRFGWKAQHATLLTFGADAYRNEMGITNELFPTEAAAGVDAGRMLLCDRIADPEDVPDPRTRRRGIDNFASFMRFLAPVARGPLDAAVAVEAERLFGAVGCASCHTPTLPTGPSSNPLFNRRPVALFSDLLLHDVGTGDGIQQASAEPNEIRTPALWGLRFRRPLLHDGSAATVDAAIRRHTSEARLAREGYERLSEAERVSILSFLGSL
jgi:CxxC motif-containing protein (DUF1111 family)